MTDKTPDKNGDLATLLADLRKNFIADIPVRLEEMESTILAMEQGTDFTENYESLYRHTHSLKGAAGSYGLHIITSICHSMEDALIESRDQERFNLYGADYWLQYVDLIRSILLEINNNKDNFEHFDAKLKELQTYRPGGSSFELHCLVVSPSAFYENLFPSSFEKHNIKFAFCHDGYKALGRLLTESFDLLISDQEIPLLNGQALFGSLRLSGSKNKDIKTILLTSKAIHGFNRRTDPDYVVTKDKEFVANLADIIHSISHELSA